MSRVQASAAGASIPKPSPTPTVAIGPQILALLEVAYRARRPVLLEGPTGVGKSQIVEQFAAAAGIDFRVLDLSLLEPPDLVGLPQLIDGRTHYAFPAELPTEGAGVLMLEELNRAEIPVMQPALQLLSARRLHAYELPPAWFCVAAINPEQDDYQVNRLDKALRSRFLQLSVHADTDEWLLWADHKNVHPVVTSFVRRQPDVFETSAPRSWAYAAEVLSKLSVDELKNRDLVLTLIRGYLPIAWATALTASLDTVADVPQLDAARCKADDGAAYVAGLLKPLLGAGRTDAAAMLAYQLHEHLVSGEIPAGAAAELASDFPGDLREQIMLATQASNAPAKP